MFMAILLRQMGMDSEEIAEVDVRRRLWGYPDLVKKFRDGVLPAIAEANERIRIARDERSQEDITMGSLRSASEGRVQDEGPSGSVLPQMPSIQTACEGDASEPSVATQKDVQPDKLVQETNCLPFDRCFLSTATSANIEAFESPHEDMISQPEVPEIGNTAILRSVIVIPEEVTPTVGENTAKDTC